MRVLLKAPFSPYSGYGQDGLGLAQTFTDYGADVYLQPTHVDAPLPAGVAGLLTKRLEAPFDLGICHVDPGQIEATSGMRRACKMLVGWTMWEASTLENMELSQRATLAHRLEGFDLLLAYDEVSAGALAPYVGDVPLQILQGGYQAADWPYMERDWYSHRFGFCMVGALHERKNPYAAIQAFLALQHSDEEFARHAELHLKDVSGYLPPAMEQAYVHLRVHNGTWSTEMLATFYGKQHVLLSPSRGEGKNMPALEMLSTGGTVIATNWGGHAQWLSEDLGYPLSYALVPIPHVPEASWAEADVEDLKALMLHAFRHRGEAKLKGECGSRLIPAMCSWESVLTRLWERLGALNDLGAGTAMLAAMSRRQAPVEVGGWQ